MKFSATIDPSLTTLPHQLLDEPDWDIFYWMTERKEVPERWKETFETKDRLGWRLRIHTKNENKETRSMPAL